MLRHIIDSAEIASAITQANRLRIGIIIIAVCIPEQIGPVLFLE